jgi:potassium channel subfamily K
MSQRTLMLQTISFLVYLMLGALVYSHIEGWLYLDALYWADFTLLTVGIGDFSPATHLGRGLLFPFAIGGIIILGLVIGSIRSLVLERGKVKMGARMVEKQRRRLLKRVQKNKVELLEPVTEENSPVFQSSDLTLGEKSDEIARAERKRRQEEFELMRKIQEDAATKRRWTSLVISGTTWLVLWFAGAAIFQACEYEQDWSYLPRIKLWEAIFRILVSASHSFVDYSHLQYGKLVSIFMCYFFSLETKSCSKSEHDSFSFRMLLRWCQGSRLSRRLYLQC